MCYLIIVNQLSFLMNCVEFFVQNEGQENPACLGRNWNIHNIMNTIMMLNPQIGHGVVSYYLRMVVKCKVVTISSDAIKVNEDVESNGEVLFDDSDSADELFELFMDTRYDDYYGTTVCVVHGDGDLIRFICDKIIVDDWNPAVAEEVKANQWDRDLRDTRKYPILISRGPYAGRHVYMTTAECQRLKISDILSGRIGRMFSVE